MNNQDTNQTVNQTETAVPVANDQSATQATALVADTKSAETVKLELTADQA